MLSQTQIPEKQGNETKAHPIDRKTQNLATRAGKWKLPHTPLLPPPQSTTGLWQSVELHGALHGHISAQVGELHLNQLPRV